MKQFYFWCSEWLLIYVSTKTPFYKTLTTALPMKTKLLSFLLLCSVMGAYAQTKNTLSVVYGTAVSAVNIHGAIGDFGFDDRRGNILGINYSKHLTKSFSLESGLYFSADSIAFSSFLPGVRTERKEQVKMITVPVYAKLDFLKYFFVDGGLLVHFQTNYSSNSTLTRQSGLGYELGLGGKYDFGRVQIFVNPYVQYHTLIKFDSSRDYFNLMDFGYKFGVGYDF